MKVGDIVVDDFYGEYGLVISNPRISKDSDFVRFGVMDGDIYEVVDVLCFSGARRLFSTDELIVVCKNDDR